MLYDNIIEKVLQVTWRYCRMPLSVVMFGTLSLVLRYCLRAIIASSGVERMARVFTE